MILPVKGNLVNQVKYFPRECESGDTQFISIKHLVLKLIIFHTKECKEHCITYSKGNYRYLFPCGESVWFPSLESLEKYMNPRGVIAKDVCIAFKNELNKRGIWVSYESQS
jgi:hypothetical protein